MSHMCNNTSDNCLHCIKEQNTELKTRLAALASKPLIEPAGYGRTTKSNRPDKCSTDEWLRMATARACETSGIHPRFALLTKDDFAALCLECGVRGAPSFALATPAGAVSVSPSSDVLAGTLLLINP